jgi:hypothetical protein
MPTTATKIFALAALLIGLSLPSVAQNTKGDRPPSTRETRFKKSDKKKRHISGKKDDKPNNAQIGYEPRKKTKGGERSGRPITRVRKIKPSKSGSARNVYKERYWTANSSQKKAERTRGKDRSFSNRSQLSRLQSLQGPEPRPTHRKPKVKPRSDSRSYIARKTINIQARFPRPKRKVEKASTRDIAGRRIRTKNYHSKPQQITARPISGRTPSRSKAVKVPKSQSMQFGRFKNYSSVTKKRYEKRKRVVTRSVSAMGKSVYSQNGKFVNNSEKIPKATEQPEPNDRVLSRLKGLQSQPVPKDRRVRNKPLSVSRPFLKRRSTNVWSHFPRKKNKGEVATTTDIAGERLRTKNYHSPVQGITIAPSKFDRGRKRIGDRPYRGPSGGYRSVSRKGHKAWRGDIAGRSIRGIKTPREDRASRQRGGFVSGTQSGERRPGKEPLPVRKPGVWGDVLRFATGKIKGRAGVKGGGSVSGRVWNNGGNAINVRTPRADAGRAGTFQGNLKPKRRRHGGGSVSGKLWNNENEAVITKVPPRKALQINTNPTKVRRLNRKKQGEEFAGSIKANRPVKGGGTVSGKLWNNKRMPVTVRTPDERANRMRGYSGNIRASRPVKGGGSVSGKLWNNKRHAIEVRTPDDRANRLRGFSGNIRASRPVKGGGSVSGKLWNNGKTPITVRTPGDRAEKMRGFQGNLKVRPKNRVDVSGFPQKRKLLEDGQPGFVDQGEEYTGSIKYRKPEKSIGKGGTYQGTIKTKRPEKGGGSVSGILWNNNGKPINVRTPDGSAGRVGSYSGELRLSAFKRDYVRNPNSSSLATHKKRPTKSVFDEGKLQAKVLQPKYIKNKHAADNASKVKEPGRSYARAADFQGNIKMHKFTLFEKNRDLHPDAKFIRTNKNNVDEEKDILTNFKLWWARLFRKNETQPDHLKEKLRKPRYDKGEQGLWYE